MARLPIVGGDTGNWGTVLNDFLSQSLNSAGTLKGTSVSAAGAEMTTNKGAINGYASLDSGGKVPSAQLPTATNDTSTQRVRVSKGGTLTGTRQEINLIQGSNVTITTADDSANNRVNITIAGNASAVTSVNTYTGDVVLGAADVSADPIGSADAVAAKAPAFIRYNTGTSSYATRASVTGDTSRMVIWVGPTAPTIGGSGAINDVDVWWKTP
jgi:hypothetical protein